MNANASTSSPLRRTLVSLFFCVLASSLILDAIPWSWTSLVPAKESLSSLYNRIGLWQGEWPLFAPNPVVDNGWLSADYTDVEGNRYTWNSPHWVQTDAWSRFYRFRHVNLYNRIHLLQNVRGLRSFTEYLSRTVSTDPSLRIADPLQPTPPVATAPDPGGANKRIPIAEMKIYRIGKQMSLPTDGTLPPRSEVMWTLRTELLHHWSAP